MSESRSLVSQLCAAFSIYNCLQFAQGSVTDLQIILIAELHKKDSEIPSSLEQLSWFDLWATAIMGAMGVLGNLLLLLLIRRAGKRKLGFFSVTVIGLCQAIVAVVGFLEPRGPRLWIPPIALIVGFFTNTMGIGTMVYMLPSEIFPSSIRYIGTSISVSVKMILKSVMNKLFLYIVDAITLSGVFLFFAVVNLVALVTYYFLFPETEGRSLNEIKRQFKGGKYTKEP